MAITHIIESLGGTEQIRMVELGKIKIGGLGKERPSQGGGTYRQPEKHDHFTITTMNRVPGKVKGDLIPDKQLMEQLVTEYGDSDNKLRQIPIRLLSDEIDDVLQVAFVWYHGARCCARSDGREVTWFNNPANGRVCNPPITEAWQPEMFDLTNSKGLKLFKLHSVFNCIVAAKEARWGGVYKFRTTSLISFKQLYATLVHIHQLTGGILRGMPLMLRLRGVQVSPEGKTSTVYVVHAELVGAEIQQIQQLAIEQAKWRIENKMTMDATQKEYRKLLVGPGQEPPEDAREISAEFQPEDLEIAPEAEGATSILDEQDEQDEPDESASDEAAGDVEIIDTDEPAKGQPPADESPAEEKPAERQPSRGADAISGAAAAIAEPKVKPLPISPLPSEPEKPAAEAKPATVTGKSDYATFVLAIKDMAKTSGNEALVDDVLKKIPLSGLFIKSTQVAVGPPARQKVLDAVRDGRLDWSTGKVTDPAKTN